MNHGLFRYSILKTVRIKGKTVEHFICAPFFSTRFVKSSILDITPSSPLEVKRRFRGTFFTLLSCSAYSSSPKVEVIVPPKRH
jgi:hypothetical protein